MKRILTIIALLVAGGVSAMPIGLRTAAWSVSAANGRAAVATLLPESGGETQISDALASFEDESVSANIAGDVEAYEEFREWALGSGARADVLSASPTAWLSFATFSPVLVAEPQDGDLAIDEAQMGEDGKIEAVFSLDGVHVNQAAQEERLKSVFGVSGASVLDETQFSADNLTLSLSPTGDGRVKATVLPKSDASNGLPKEFFMKVKVKQL